MKYIFLGIFILLMNISFAKQIVVCSTCDIKTIKAGIQQAEDGDEVIIKEGLYKEHDLVILKKISIKGEGFPVVDGGNIGTIFSFKTDSFSIENLKIINVGHSYTKDFAAVLVSKSRHFTIKNITLEKVFFGFLIEKSRKGIIENNKVSSENTDEAGAGNGVHLWHCFDMTIRNNEVHNMRDGIYFEFVKRTKIYGNHSHNNIRYGLHFMFSNNDEYYDNKFENNGAGVAVMFSKFIKMHENKFLFNWGTASYGLLLKEIYDAEIHDNIFANNTIGINIEGSTRINYSHNTFKSNGWAVKVRGACYKNNFHENNFIQNAFDIAYNSKLNGNRFDNNYWSGYTGYDLDKDGIGDVPFRPVKLFSYVVNQTPETIVLLRSLFVDIINFSEKISPVFTPDDLMDNSPRMNMIDQ